MSAVGIARALLIGRAALTALVPTTNIQAGVLPQGTGLPAIVVNEISSQDAKTLHKNAMVRVSSRVQITVMASNYPACKDIMAQVRHACRYKVGLLGGHASATCQLDGVGPDFSDDSGRWMQTQDLLITYDETTS